MAEKKFGNDTWRCDKLDAESSLRLLIKTSKIFGPASNILGAVQGMGRQPKADVITTQALAEFVGKLNEDEAINYIKHLVDQCRVNGMEPTFGIHCGDMDIGELFELCFWILGVQFGSFLGAATAAGKGLKRPAAA